MLASILLIDILNIHFLEIELKMKRDELMEKICIFYTKKSCNNCNECNICDLDKNKICNNCGICILEEGIDIKAIKIDEINEEDSIEIEDPALSDNVNIQYEAIQEQSNLDLVSLESFSENNEDWKLIDDIDGLAEILLDINKSNKFTKEVFPGLIYIDKNQIK